MRDMNCKLCQLVDTLQVIGDTYLRLKYTLIEYLPIDRRSENLTEVEQRIADRDGELSDLLCDIVPEIREIIRSLPDNQCDHVRRET